MGKSSTYRKGPSWQGSYMNAKEPKVSKGGGVKPEGTQMSGEGDWGRKGAKSGGNKSKVSYSTSKVSVPTGKS